MGDLEVVELALRLLLPACLGSGWLVVVFLALERLPLLVANDVPFGLDQRCDLFELGVVQGGALHHCHPRGVLCQTGRDKRDKDSVLAHVHRADREQLVDVGFEEPGVAVERVKGSGDVDFDLAFLVSFVSVVLSTY